MLACYKSLHKRHLHIISCNHIISYIVGYTYTFPMYKFGQTSSTGFRSSLHVSRIFSNSLIARSPCLFVWAVILLNWPRSDYYAREDASLLFSRGFSIHNGFGTPWSTQTGALYGAVRSPDTTEHLRAPLMIDVCAYNASCEELFLCRAMFTSPRGRLVAQKVKNISWVAFKSIQILGCFYRTGNIFTRKNSL